MFGKKHPSTTHFGLVAQFDTTGAIFHACEKIRDAGFTKWDAHTPFPVHGLDKAMGLKKTVLPWIVLVMALTGTATGIALQTWIHVIEYPLVYAGKPYFSWPAFVPVTFEITVLFGALGALLGMFHLCKLPQFYHPVFRSDRMDRASDDQFFISIESEDPKFDANATPELLKKLGAVHVEMVEH